MSNRCLFVRGQRDLRPFAVDASTVIEAGDMVFLDTDDVKPASSFTWDTNLATTQGNFAAVFAGIAAEPHPDGVAGSILVDVSPNAIYEFEVASASFQVGALLGPDKASGNAILSQVLETAAAGASIAKAAEAKASATSLLVTFASALTTASCNVNAGIG